jgi:SAM-dependent methyltransferase
MPGLRRGGWQLTGVDLSREMLVVARAKAPPAVRLAQSAAENLPFADETFDVVVSTSVFHYFRRPLDALGEASRVLRPGGRLVITDWCDDFVACHVCDLILRLFDRAHFRAYGAAALTQMIEAGGFEAVSVDRYKIDWLWGLMTAIARKPG